MSDSDLLKRLVNSGKTFDETEECVKVAFRSLNTFLRTLPTVFTRLPQHVWVVRLFSKIDVAPET